MENKNNDDKKIWDYMYNAIIGNGNEFNPGKYKITLSKGENELEYDSETGFFCYWNDFTSMCLNADTDYDDFLEYVAYRFNVDVPK